MVVVFFPILWLIKQETAVIMYVHTWLGSCQVISIKYNHLLNKNRAANYTYLLSPWLAVTYMHKILGYIG